MKSFAEGVNLFTNNNTNKNFTILKLEKKRISISLFKNKSFIFTENFDFGLNLIIKDISKLCSLSIEEVEYFINKVELKDIIENNNETYLEKKYFSSSPFRKIKYQLILDIFSARLEELFEICCTKNTNTKNLKISDKIYIYIDANKLHKNVQYVLGRSEIAPVECILNCSSEENLFSGVTGACELISKGWEKEAIPVINKKKSFISGFFSKLFN